MVLGKTRPAKVVPLNQGCGAVSGEPAVGMLLNQQRPALQSFSNASSALLRHMKERRGSWGRMGVYHGGVPSHGPALWL